MSLSALVIRGKGSTKMKNVGNLACQTLVEWPPSACLMVVLPLHTGELNVALEHFTAAIQANPTSAPLFAKRAR